MVEKAAHVIFKGRVQGVFFRANTLKIAARHGLTGWVRNLDNGNVEAWLEGREQDVKKAIDWCNCQQPHAVVDAHSVEWMEPSGKYHEFIIRQHR